MGEVTNPFDRDSVARRYASARPYYHHTALRLAAPRLGIGTVNLALDLGCGTGLSTRAVREWAEKVVAVDASLAMLRRAEPLTGVTYLAAGAERLPLVTGSVDLVTAGAAFHWFDQERAFGECARVLRAGAPLVVYSDFFTGRLEQSPEFSTWLTNFYLPRYPAPARHAYFDIAAAEHAGFGPPAGVEDELLVPLTCTQLADYLLSQSNAAVAIESGRIDAAALRDEIIDEIGAFFPADNPTDAVFAVRVWTSTLPG